MDQAHINDVWFKGSSKGFLQDQRFGHLNKKSLYTLACQQLVDDFDYNVSKQTTFCVSCVEGKLQKTHFQVKAEHKLQYPLA